MNYCKICSEKKFLEINFNNLFLRTDSSNKKLHNYESRICSNCGVVFQYPQISEDVIAKHYNADYRKTNYSLNLDNNLTIDFPLQIDRTGISFQRFYYFFKILNEIKNTEKDLNFADSKTILDYGAYQGAFLYACKKTWKNIKTIAYDYNDNGLEFAKKFLNIDYIYKAKNITKDLIDHKVDICVALHSLEHMSDPVNFLKHVKSNILKNDGYVYIEVPCALTSEFNNPSHLFMYTKDSIKYLFEKCGYKILHISEENLVNYHKMSVLKRHIQTSIHCLAHTNGTEKFNEEVNLGEKIKNEIEKNHKVKSNEIYFIMFKKFFKQSFLITYYGLFVFLGYISNKISYSIFSKSNAILKKIKILKKMGRK